METKGKGKWVTCKKCQGKGKDKLFKCRQCEGYGEIWIDLSDDELPEART